MRKPKEQVDEEGNEAHFFEDLESSDDVDNSDDDSAHAIRANPRSPPASASSCAASSRPCGGSCPTGTTTGKTTSTRSCSLSRRPPPLGGRTPTSLSGNGGAVSAKHKRKRSAARPACSGPTRLRRRAAARRRHVRTRLPARPLPPLWRRDAARARGRRHPHARQGGTLDVFLANHALKRGYDATIFTYNLDLFDPTWFALPNDEIRARLAAQASR